MGGAGNRLRFFLFVYKNFLTVFCLRFLVSRLSQKCSLTLFNLLLNLDPVYLLIQAGLVSDHSLAVPYDFFLSSFFPAGFFVR